MEIILQYYFGASARYFLGRPTDEGFRASFSQSTRETIHWACGPGLSFLPLILPNVRSWRTRQGVQPMMLAASVQDTASK